MARPAGGKIGACYRPGLEIRQMLVDAAVACGATDILVLASGVELLDRRMTAVTAVFWLLAASAATARAGLKSPPRVRINVTNRSIAAPVMTPLLLWHFGAVYYTGSRRFKPFAGVSAPIM
jgi:hypothetical protein